MSDQRERLEKFTKEGRHAGTEVVFREPKRKRKRKADAISDPEQPTLEIKEFDDLHTYRWIPGPEDRILKFD